MPDRLTSRHNIVHGYFALSISLMFLVFSAFFWTMVCLILGVLLISLGYIRIWKKDQIPNLIIEGIVLMMILLSFGLASWITDYMNQNAPRKAMCGWAKNIKKSGRSSGQFLLRNEQNSQIFPYTYQIQDYAGSEICIEYSLDQRLSDYPYIHEIYPQSSITQGKEIK
ncbi:hypothetical protein F895_00788 [Acinetobacter sp. CIP 64.2]|uniref:hypothetical protein n=1 Tax=Acinetobacter TaxID=469 RepID=UPI0002D0CAD2|nr:MULTISPECIES: hypothetical protein [Acinetobacter]ENX17644.1 hypothetical protein F895_00788 [Acinetobacter sp. CIP 64.2]